MQEDNLPISEIVSVDPKRFFTPRRLDLIVKRRLFSHWLHGGNPEAEADYLWHIDQRRGTHKALEAYIPAARSILQSMQENGYKGPPIALNRDGEFLEGAHRIACAAALGINVDVVRLDTDHKWPPWGEEWFQKHGMGYQLPSILKELHS